MLLCSRFRKIKICICHIDEYFFESEISKGYDINEILEKIDEKLNTVDCNYHDVTRYELESIRVKKKVLPPE